MKIGQEVFEVMGCERVKFMVGSGVGGSPMVVEENVEASVVKLVCLPTHPASGREEQVVV